MVLLGKRELYIFEKSYNEQLVGSFYIPFLQGASLKSYLLQETKSIITLEFLNPKHSPNWLYKGAINDISLKFIDIKP